MDKETRPVRKFDDDFSGVASPNLAPGLADEQLCNRFGFLIQVRPDGDRISLAFNNTCVPKRCFKVVSAFGNGA